MLINIIVVDFSSLALKALKILCGLLKLIITVCDNITHKKQLKETKFCQPVTTNEGPALDSRVLARDLEAESAMNGSTGLRLGAPHGYGQTSGKT